MVAGVAPDRLVGEQHLHVLHKGQQFPPGSPAQRARPPSRDSPSMYSGSRLSRILLRTSLVKGLPVLEIPRHRVEAVGAVPPAARYEQAGAHSHTVGDVAVFDGCIVHAGILLLSFTAPLYLVVSDHLYPMGTHSIPVLPAPASPAPFRMPCFLSLYRLFVYIRSNLPKKRPIFVTSFFER